MKQILVLTEINFFELKNMEMKKVKEEFRESISLRDLHRWKNLWKKDK